MFDFTENVEVFFLKIFMYVCMYLLIYLFQRQHEQGPRTDTPQFTL